MSNKILRIKLVKSTISSRKSHKATVQSLGLRKLNQVVEQPDSPSIRGMIETVSHLLEVEEVEA